MNETHPAARHNRGKSRLRQVNINKVLGVHLFNVGGMQVRISKYRKKLKKLLTLPVSQIEVSMKPFKNTNEAEMFGYTASFDGMFELWKLRFVLANDYNDKVNLVIKTMNELSRIAAEQQFCRESNEVFEGRIDGELPEACFNVGVEFRKQ